MVTDIEILKKKDTPLLSRQRVSAMVFFEGETPSRLDLKNVIAKKLSADPKLTVIRHIYQRYGNQKAKIISHIYKDKETMVRLEGETLVNKHEKKVEEKPKEEAKPEEKKEEPNEDKNEEPKAEVKEEAKPAEEKKGSE